MTIYRSALISRRQGLGEAQFRDHWLRVHGARRPPAGQRLVHGDPLLRPIAVYRVEELRIV